MIRKLNKICHFLALILILVLIVPVYNSGCTLWGTPLFELIVENQTEYNLTIYMNGYKVSDIGPGEEISGNNFRLDISELLTAKDMDGETVFARKFDVEEMQWIDRKRVWRVVIPLSPENLQWAVYDGQFYTRDIKRAQAEIPFTIVLPEYFPGNPHNLLPIIQGPLEEYQHDDKVELAIYYALDLGGEEDGIIEIHEGNYAFISPDPAKDPQIEYIEISGIQMIKTIEILKFKYFSFTHNDICFTLDFHNYNLPPEEAVKVIESMVE